MKARVQKIIDILEELSIFRKLKMSIIYIKEKVKSVYTTFRFYTSDKYWFPRRAIFRENRYTRILKLEEQKKNLTKKKNQEFLWMKN